jgi:hypothetical protein
MCVLLGSGCTRAGYSPDVGRSDSIVDQRPGSEASLSEARLVDGPPADRSRVDRDVSSCLDPICDLWPQCGCKTGDGGSIVSCEVTSTGQRACLPGGAKTHGATCTALGGGECQPGTSCLSMTGWPAGLHVCFQYCSKHSDCTLLGAGALCVLGSAYFNLCTLPCNPLAQTGCPNGTQCTIYNSTTLAATNCVPPGPQTAGQTCATHPDCGPSLICVAKVCAPLCVVGSDGCSSPKTCKATGFVIGGTNYGYCA